MLRAFERTPDVAKFSFYASVSITEQDTASITTSEAGANACPGLNPVCVMRV